MSRIGKSPVVFDKAVQISVGADNTVLVKGAKASQSVFVRPEISVNIADGEIVLSRTSDVKEVRALHGLYRALLQNAVTGVTKGFSKTLVMNGVGYRAAVAGKTLELTLGYSHPIKFPIPDGITITVDKQTKVVVTGASKELVGQVAAKIRGFRAPEPYLGKGVKYEDETIRRKAGKSGGK
jgi:large subunit ribosomal protein L6